MALPLLFNLTKVFTALALGVAATAAAHAAEKASIRLKWVPQAQFAGI